MRLERVSISNYRSLESVQLSRLDDYVVLVGPNNSGKSSVLNALSLVARAVAGPSFNDWSGIVTDDSPERSLEVDVVLRPSDIEREDLVARLARSGMGDFMEAGVIASPFARQIDYAFRSPPGLADRLHLASIRLLAQDGLWAEVQRMQSDEISLTNPRSVLVNLDQLARPSPSMSLDEERLRNARDAGPIILRLQPFTGILTSLGAEAGPASRWPLELLHAYFAGAFFLSPFRHSASRMAASAVAELASDGSNLAQVLHTIQSNDRGLFDELEAFVRAALPDVGQLQSPLESTTTYVGFLRDRGRPHVRLEQMGGGVEQILMLGVVLLSTSADRPLFVEEPEGHLHPGAQRFLLERLRGGKRQVVIATHSPVFLDPARFPVIYRTRLASGRTVLDRLEDPAGFEDLLVDIGVRYSDVLLSNAVLFVEGPTDREIIVDWADRFGRSLPAAGVNVVSIGGGEGQRGAKVRSAVLAEMSSRAPIPHLIVVDRDERSEREIDGLKDALGDRLWILEKRELENYVLVPRAILAALKEKYRDNDVVRDRIEASTDADVEQAIEEAVLELQGVVLAKRIRSEIGTLKEGLIPRSAVAGLSREWADADELTKRVEAEMEAELATHISTLDLPTLVRSVLLEIGTAWKDPIIRRNLAPGEEVLDSVFRRFGGEFHKRTDSPRIARAMEAGDLAPELGRLLDAARSLGG